MDRIRISATDLDGYLYFRDGDYLSLNRYIQRLKGEDPPGPEQVAGIKFHEAIQRQGTEREGYDPRGYWIRVLGVIEGPKVGAIYYLPEDKEIVLPLPVRTELRVDKLYTLPNGREVEVRGRVDAVSGLEVTDYKTTKKIDLERYAEAYQWRVYMSMMPQMLSFRYEVFQLKKMKGGGAYYPEYNVTDYKRLILRPYRAMEKDVRALIAEYDEFLRGLAAEGRIELTEKGVTRTAKRG